MTRHESDREDLIKEATAYVRRAEFSLKSTGAIVFVGIRRDDVLAIYYDQDPMYQFDVEGRIRRALVDGVLFRGQGESLSRLQRQRSAQETVLTRSDLSRAELTTFLTAMDRVIQMVLDEIDDGSICVLRAVPANANVEFLVEIRERLAAVLKVSPRVSPPINVTR